MCEEIQGVVEKQHKVRCFRLVTRIGSMMLLNGGEIFRTYEAMTYAAKALKLKEFSSFVIANGIFASMMLDGQTYSSRICSVRLSAIRLCRIEAINNLSRQIAAGLDDLDRIESELDRIETLEASGNLSKILASGIGSGCFCYLFGGSFKDSLCAFIAGVALYLFLLYLAPKIELARIMCNIAGSMLVAAVCCGLYMIGVGESLGNMMIGAIFPLVPGIPITNSIRNFLENDYLSGLVRLADACLTAGSIAVGVGIVMKLWSYGFGGIGI